MIGWNTNTRILRDFWDEMGKTAGCAACASPGGKKHSVACLNRQEEWKTRTIPQPERATRDTDAEMQQDTQAPEPSSSSSYANDRNRRQYRETGCERHQRHLNNSETANDEPENPGVWKPAKRIRSKSKPLVSVEKTESDAYRFRTHGKRRAAENGNRQHCKQENK